MYDTPPIKKRRRPFLFWAGVAIIGYSVLYPLSFGPVCWLDSRRLPEAKAVAVSRWLNTFYGPIVGLAQRLDNSVGDAILWYAGLFAAHDRQAEVAVLGRPGATTGTAWLVWYPRHLRPGPWLCATPIPEE